MPAMRYTDGRVGVGPNDPLYMGLILVHDGFHPPPAGQMPYWTDVPGPQHDLLPAEYFYM